MSPAGDGTRIGERSRARLRDTQRVWREQGAAGVWFGALAETCYRRLLVIEHTLDPTPAVHTHRPIRIASYAQAAIPDAVAAAIKESPATVRGDRIFVVSGDDGGMLHHCWVAEGPTAPVPYLGAELDLAPGVVFVHSAYTRPDARGDHLSAARSAAMLGHYADRGFAAAVAAILPENEAGLRSPMKIGYRVAGRVGAVRLGRRWRTFARVPADLVLAIRRDA